MASIFGMNCGATLGNTARQKCDVKIGRAVSLISIESGYTIDQATNIADSIWETLDELTRNNDPSIRVYPIHGIQSVADNTQDRVQQTAGGTGNTTTLRDEKAAYTYTFWPNVCEWAQVQKFNGSETNRDYYIVTDSNQLVAIERNGGIGGVRFSDVFVSGLRMATDDARSQGTIAVTVDNPAEWRNNLIVITPTNGLLTDLTGIADAQPIDLNAQPLPVAGTFKIGVVSGCGGGAGSTDLVHLYEAALEATGSWVVSNAKTGVVITPTSITATIDTVNPNNSFLTFVTPTTGGYVSGDGVKFQLKGVTVLTAASMIGYEGKSVIVKN